MSLDLGDVPVEFRPAVEAALKAAGVETGHLAVEIVGEDRIRELNREFRDLDRPTDVLSFPVDEAGPSAGPRELGDVVVCPGHCSDLHEAVVHGVLHLCGYDHETDQGEMLTLQGRILGQLRADGGTDARPGAAVTRSGFVGLAGRPNVGKSTLVNAIVGSTVAIASVRPQTTRRAIRGVATDTEAGTQLVLVDLPGVQRPRDVLTTRMQRRVEQELADADVALLVINGEEGVGAGDRFIAGSMLAVRPSTRVICAVNKADRLGRNIVPVLAEAAELEGVDEVFPVSALRGEGVEELARYLAGLMPEGPYLYPPEDHSDQSPELLMAELIRGAALIRTRDEVPHSIEVKVRRISERDDGLTVVEAEIWVESESQKGILIGQGGFRVGEIGSDARRTLEQEVGGRVHLDLRVKVRKGWRRDEDMLDRLGIE
jgi:GTPase